MCESRWRIDGAGVVKVDGVRVHGLCENVCC